MNGLDIGNIGGFKNDIFFNSLKKKSPEYRVLFFPQILLITLWEEIFNKKLGKKDLHNCVYWGKINGYFLKIGFKKSHSILDNLENENSLIMLSHYKNLISFINLIKIEFMKGEKHAFFILINNNDTIKTIKDKIERKEDEIKKYIEKEGLKFIFNGKGVNNFDGNIASAQILDMTFISLQYILQDNNFLKKMLSENQGEISTSKQKVLGLMEKIIKL